MRLSKIWRNLRHRDRMESDLDAELNAYVDLLAAQKVRSGVSPEDARRAALIESEGVEQVKERVRDVRAGAWLATIWRDVQFGARLLAKERAFTFAAVTMLALGIGATTAVFSVVNGVLLRGLPYANPDRIVSVYEKRVKEGQLRGFVSVPDLLDWRAQSTSFQSMTGTANVSTIWQSDAGAEQVPAAVVSPEFFDVFGVRPALGGTGSQQPDTVVVLTHGFWQRRLGGDASIIGRSLTIDSRSMTVAGVLPAAFEYPVRDVEFFLPHEWRSRQSFDRASHDLEVMARLKPGVSRRAAQTEMDAIAARLERQYPEMNAGHGVNLEPMRDVLLGPLQTPLLVLQAAVAFVLLIGCGNLANLLLARTLARDREFSVRLAIGAGRGRLVRQLLCESLLLAMIGGAAGIAVTYAAVPALRTLAPRNLAAPGIRTFEVDSTALGICLLLSVMCGLVFGIAPAWRGSAANLAAALKEGVVSGGRRGERMRKVLIVSQVALSTVLLTGAGVFLRSFAALRSVDPGFRAQGVLTLQMPIPANRYREPAQVSRLTSEVVDAIRRLPGIQAVGTTTHLPVSGMDGRTGLAIEDVPPADPNVPRRAHIRYVSPGYFQAMGVRMVAGRPFQESDRSGGQPVMIVNETAAKKFFPQGKALGHRGHRGGVTGPWADVVGVVADVRHWGLDVEPRPEQYYCSMQDPRWFATLVVRSSGDPGQLATAIRQQVRQIDPQVPLARVQTMDEVVSRSIGSEQSILILLGSFAALALLLTSAGIWGTMAYLLTQRRREIGIRLALGATNRRIVREIVARAMRLAGLGLATGLATAAVLARVISAKLFGVELADPWTYAAVALVLAAVALLANYAPAARTADAASYSVLREE
jgi:putative ABC transport system permease protein